MSRQRSKCHYSTRGRIVAYRKCRLSFQETGTRVGRVTSSHNDANSKPANVGETDIPTETIAPASSYGHTTKEEEGRCCVRSSDREYFNLKIPTCMYKMCCTIICVSTCHSTFCMAEEKFCKASIVAIAFYSASQVYAMKMMRCTRGKDK